MFRIAHIFGTLNSLQMKNTLIALNRALKPQNIEFIIICLKDTGIMELGKAEDIRILTLDKKPGLDLECLFHLTKRLKEERVDVVHSHDPAGLFYGTLAAKGRGLKAVHTGHLGSAPAGRWLLTLNRYVICPSAYLKNRLMKDSGVPREKIRVIYNSSLNDLPARMKSPEVVKQTREELGLNAESFVIGNIGPLADESDFDTLFKAFKKLVVKKVDARLAILGDGDGRKKLEERISAMDLSANVKLIDGLRDAGQLLLACDIFVLSAYRESALPLIPAAMLSELPVVATKIGSHPEYIDEGKTGYLVPCGYPERIESAVMRLYANKTLRQEMARNAQKAAQRNFSFEVMTGKYAELYQGLK